MRTDLTVRAVHHGEMRIDAHVRGHALRMDYPAQGSAHPTPLEVLMASLAACAGNTIHLVLCEKMGVKVDSIEVEARAERRVENPTVLTAIELIYHLRGPILDSDVVERAMQIGEEMLCPVFAMLRSGTKITSSWQKA